MALDIRIRDQLNAMMSGFREMAMSGVMIASIIYLLALHNTTIAKIVGVICVVLLVWEAVDDIFKK